jgi:nucleoside-diphosphate-sugar epimerase
MRILVTGASGFIGSHLISRLSDSREVFAIVRNGVRVRPSEGASLIEMDLSEPLNARRLPAKIDVIVHLAQANVVFPESAKELLTVNAIAAQQLLDYGWRAGARQFLLASTGDVYGRRLGLCKESDPAAPFDYYAITKYAAEMFARAYAGLLSSCILRLFQPYGPGQSGRLIPGLARRISGGNPVRLHKECRPNLTPVFIEDVILAIERAIDTAYSGTLNIAGDRTVSMRELAEEIGRTLKRNPVFEDSGEESADFAGDNQLMKQALGRWDMVALGDGLSRTLRAGKEAL